MKGSLRRTLAIRFAATMAAGLLLATAAFYWAAVRALEEPLARSILERSEGIADRPTADPEGTVVTEGRIYGRNPVLELLRAQLDKPPDTGNTVHKGRKHVPIGTVV